MSDDVIDALLVKLGVVVDQASFTESTNAVNGLDNAINKAARDRGNTGIDRIGKNLAATGKNARDLEKGIDQFDRTVSKVPRSVGVLQTRLGSATTQMANFRKETQTVVALLSRGAAATGLGPLSGSMFAMLAGGGPLALAAAGIGGLAANAFSYSNGALSTELNASTYGVTKSQFQNFNRFGKSVTGEDDVGTQILQAAQRIKVGASIGQLPDIARYGASPSDFAGADRKSTMDVVEIIQKQIRNSRDDISRQGIAGILGIPQSGINTLKEDYRAGMQRFDKQGSTFSDQDVANARAFEASIVELTADFDKLKITLGKEVLPSLDDFVKRVDSFFSENGGASKYLDAFKKLQDGDIKGFAKSFGEAEQSTQVVTPEQNQKMTNFLLEHLPFDKLAHYTYDGAVRGWEQGGLKGALSGAREGWNASPVVANPWLDGMASDGMQAIYAKMPSAHIDNDLSKPLRPEYQPKPKMVPGTSMMKITDGQAAAQQRALQYFMQNGYSSAQAFGIVANLTQESGMSTGAVGDNGQAYGLAQWHPDRQQDFKEFFGKDIRNSTERDQLDFVNYELQNKEKAAGNALAKAKTASESADIFRRMYERPAENPADAAQRMLMADQLSRLPDSAPSTYQTVAQPSAPFSAPASSASPSSSEGNVVHIDARGSTDVHQATSEALRAANDHFQGQLTVAMSHLSMDLDQ